MGETARVFRTFINHALQHPEGPEVARVFDRTFQFDLTDDEPFHLELKGGRITVGEGDSGLDWKIRDWERATCVHTSGKVLREIIAGQKLISEAFFDRELGFGPRRMADRHTESTAIVAWLYSLVRLALEQARQSAYDEYLSELGAAR